MSTPPGPADRPRRRERPVGPPPTQDSLREAALAYLSRYSATQAGLARVLMRRVARWAYAAAAPDEQVAAAKAAARAVAARMVELGAIDDAAFAAGRARSLSRAGRSRRAIAAHLVAKGVSADAAALPDDPAAELAAALAYAKRRRLGPFRDGAADASLRTKELGKLARAGFAQPVAVRALDMPADAAEAIVIRLRQS